MLSTEIWKDCWPLGRRKQWQLIAEDTYFLIYSFLLFFELIRTFFAHLTCLLPNLNMTGYSMFVQAPVCLICFLLGVSRHLSANSRHFTTLYRFHLQRQVHEVWQGLGCVGYLYWTGFRQVGGRANGKVSSRLGVVRRGEVYKACAGGITVLYSVAVSFPWVCVAVVPRICWANPGNHCYTNSRKRDGHLI
jgi:hypothetical protein